MQSLPTLQTVPVVPRGPVAVPPGPVAVAKAMTPGSMSPMSGQGPVPSMGFSKAGNACGEDG